ncbi:hypothetical protein [Paractinoplanes toevensis]|uniref:Uncharacterized protein n=1 Tax=Paractinoplanes toevensis TaxID=571911 RepID=A0A919T7Y7_9ACTN|nr:hypothetical protein [Actinoplanes toevensis]GIM90352.1 hypothetical protein Ato02nite_021450 [Actinoplanes toevensis]
MPDTSTNVLPPEELTQEVIGQLNDAAAAFLAGQFQPARDDEPARPLPVPYVAKHRLNEDLHTRTITPAKVSAALTDVPVPLERRRPGAALAGLPVDEPARRASRLLRFLGAKP